MNQNQRKTKIFSMMMLVERRHRKFRVSMRPPSPTCLHTHMLSLATKYRYKFHDLHLFVNLGNISFKCLHLSSSSVNIRVVPIDRNLPDRKTLNKTMLRTLFRRFRNRQEMYP